MFQLKPSKISSTSSILRQYPYGNDSLERNATSNNEYRITNNVDRLVYDVIALNGTTNDARTAHDVTWDGTTYDDTCNGITYDGLTCDGTTYDAGTTNDGWTTYDAWTTNDAVAYDSGSVITNVIVISYIIIFRNSSLRTIIY